MRPNRSFAIHCFMLSLFGSSLSLIPANAWAQTGPGANIELQAFRPAMDSRGLITVDGAQTLGHKQVSFGLITHWGRNLLRFESDAASYRVEHMFTPTLVGALGLRLGPLGLEFGASLPFAVMSGDRDPDFVGAPGDPNDDESLAFNGQGIGDIGVHAKVQLLRQRRGRGPGFGLALLASLQVPSASAKASWIGSSGLTPEFTAIVDKRIGRLSLALNGGIRVRPSGVTRFDDVMALDPSGMPMPVTQQAIAVGSTVPFGAGIAFALAPRRLDLVAEVIGEVPLGASENFLPVEALGGIKVYVAENSYLTLGGGVGLLSEPGNPDVRAFMGIVFEPRLADRDGDGITDDIDDCPSEPEDFDEFADSDGCPELDNDRDGIVDVDDLCPLEPEDRDGREDDDGCPETERLDRDGDGILDHEDACPDEPEDFDDYQDQDGCPEADNDKDGILDMDDLCPDDPEDTDDWQDQDGCPDPDNDKDRILDEDDECPTEPEVYNTVDDEDGCPDRGPIEFGDDRLVVMEKIYFEYDSAVIKQTSHAILVTIAKTLQLNPDIEFIEVQGHTDQRGPDDYNLRLSQARAESVVAFLTEQGVAASRLEARGYGERMPLDRRNNRQAWAKNRRVEFVILRRETVLNGPN
jgi:OOP family OmpA-OmpF porin